MNAAIGYGSKLDALPAKEHGEDCSRVDEVFSGTAVLSMFVIPLALRRIAQHLHVASNVHSALCLELALAALQPV